MSKAPEQHQHQKRAVENIRSGTIVYTPVVELIVNAIEAIRIVKPTGGRITVTVRPDGQEDPIDRSAPVDGFIVDQAQRDYDAAWGGFPNASLTG
jgi:hypothetical protein